MAIITSILILFVAFEHLVFLYLEMFMWTKDAGRKVFGTTREEAEATKVLAANQGLYNGFISAGLIWGFFHSDPAFGLQITLFFLVCVIIAGIYGAITSKISILYFQAFPAALTMALLLLF